MQGNKEARYQRIHTQLYDLLKDSDNHISKMATIAALLHHKMEGFFWTGFYLLRDQRLLVGPYQGPLACQELRKDTGVCWACVNRGESILVPDVNQFPGHIACDSRSKSEIAVPVRDAEGNITAVMDIDSRRPEHFDAVDATQLEKILSLI